MSSSRCNLSELVGTTSDPCADSALVADYLRALSARGAPPRAGLPAGERHAPPLAGGVRDRDITEEFVRESARRAGVHLELSVLAFPRGLCAEQDLYAVVRGKPGGWELRMPPFPRGAVDEFAIGARDVTVGGSASIDGEDAAPEVRLYVGADHAGVRGAGPAGGDRTFRLEFARDVSPDAVIRVEARTAAGLSNLVGMGTLRPHLEGRVRWETAW